MNASLVDFRCAYPANGLATLWGLGDASSGTYPSPDVVPDTQWLGKRFNLEQPDSTGRLGVRNLQTFLGINGPDPLDPKDLVLPKMPVATPFDEKTRDRLLESVRLKR